MHQSIRVVAIPPFGTISAPILRHCLFFKTIRRGGGQMPGVKAKRKVNTYLQGYPGK